MSDYIKYCPDCGDEVPGYFIQGMSCTVCVLRGSPVERRQAEYEMMREAKTWRKKGTS